MYPLAIRLPSPADEEGTVSQDTISDLEPSWVRSLRAQDRSDQTIRSYLLATGQLAEHIGDKPITHITTDDLRSFLLSMLEQEKATATVRQRHASLRVFFRWLHDEGEIETNPIERVKPPKLEEAPVPIIPDGDLRKLLRATEGKGFNEARDHAIIRFLLDTGVRVGELVSMTVDSISWEYEVVTITGKTGMRTVPFGMKTGQALDRYLRRRRAHPLASLDAFWLGHRGMPLSESGVTQMLRRRCRQAGIEDINPHRFRHTMAHLWIEGGGNEGDLQRIGGWKSRTMLSRYGASAAEQRARSAHRQHSPGDRF